MAAEECEILSWMNLSQNTVYRITEVALVESEENLDNIETEVRTLTIRQLSELLSNNKIINSTEWILLMKRNVEKIIQTGNGNTTIKVKVQNVNMESIEISILRATERSYEKEKEDIYLNESSVSLDDESEYSNTSQEENLTILTKADSVDKLPTTLVEKDQENASYDSIDEWIESLAKENERENKRISSYPIDYYVKSGTFSD